MNQQNKVAECVTNMYRTENYIVDQNFYVMFADGEIAIAFSYDIFYARNPERDQLYEITFYARHNIEGKRLPTSMYSREYVY